LHQPVVVLILGSLDSTLLIVQLHPLQLTPHLWRHAVHIIHTAIVAAIIGRLRSCNRRKNLLPFELLVRPRGPITRSLVL
jgi:hypothetical protein